MEVFFQASLADCVVVRETALSLAAHRGFSVWGQEAAHGPLEFFHGSNSSRLQLPTFCASEKQSNSSSDDDIIPPPTTTPPANTSPDDTTATNRHPPTMSSTTLFNLSDESKVRPSNASVAACGVRRAAVLIRELQERIGRVMDISRVAIH